MSKHAECPHKTWKTIETRKRKSKYPSLMGAEIIRRRRKCLQCGLRKTTYESPLDPEGGTIQELLTEDTQKMIQMAEDGALSYLVRVFADGNMKPDRIRADLLKWVLDAKEKKNVKAIDVQDDVKAKSLQNILKLVE